MRDSHTGMRATALLHVSSDNMYMSCVVCRYVRAEIVAGFVNALFLLFIAFFIFSEAIEVSREPPLSLEVCVTSKSPSCTFLSELLSLQR